MAEQISIIVKTSGMEAAMQQINKIQSSTSKPYDIVVNFDKNGEVVSSIERTQKGINELVAVTRKYNAETQQMEVAGTKVTTSFQKQAAALEKAHAQLQREAQAARDAANAYDYYAQKKQTATQTPLQQRINDIVGVNNKPKSAYESAQAFQRAWSLESHNAGAVAAREEADALKELDTARAEAQKAQDAYTKSTQKASFASSNLVKNISKFATWYIIGNVFSSIVRNFRDAISAMKDVDTQLTNIQKVSGKTTEEIKNLGDAAYETASKYGVAASQYLEAVYTFQKAGLGDSAEKLGELATKTMLVGDTTEEMATKFLIATNAAWKLNGSYEQLSHAVDYADYINNNYAATLSDIADGLPVVAATAAQAGMTMEETMAAIGTIVSGTAQTGRRVGTALRALIMNLAKETGDLGDGFTVTEESIKSLDAILLKYEPDAVKAAQAAGKIVDPMTAIAAMAKASEEGLLNQAELFDLLSGIGGKLRTTQLVALVQNTEMYNKMLSQTASVAGTADSEIETMLTSWESKTQILKNTWTNFVQKTISTDFAKTLLDIDTALVKFAGNLVNVLVPLGVFAAKLALTSKATRAHEIATLADTAASEARAVALMKGHTTEDEAAAATARHTAEIERQKAARWDAAASFTKYAGIAVAAISLVVMAVQAYERAQDEARQKAAEAAEKTLGEIDALKQLKEQYADIIDSTSDEAEKNRQLADFKKTLVEQYGFEYEALRNINAERQTGIDLLNEEIAKQSQKWLTDPENANRYNEATQKLTSTYSFYANGFNNLSGAQQFEFGLATSIASPEVLDTVARSYKNVSEAVAAYTPRLQELNEKIAKGLPLLAEERAEHTLLSYAVKEAQGVIDTYNAVFTKGNQLLAERIFAENANRAAHVNSITTFEAYVTGLRREAGENEALADALENLANEAFPQFVQANIDATSALFDAEGQLTDAGKAALDADGKFAALARQIANTRAEAAQTSYANLISELNKTGDAALTNAAKLALFKTYFEDVTGRTMSATEERYYRNNPDAQKTTAATLLERLQAEAASLASYVPSGGGSGSSSGGGGTGKGGGETPAEKALKEAKSVVEKRKAELELLEAQEASIDKRADQMRSISAALREQYKWEVAVNGESADSIRLKKEILENENAITELYKKQKEEQIEKNKKTREERLERRKQDVEILQSELSVMEAQGQSPDRLIEQHRKIIDALREQQAFTNDIVEENRIEKEILDEEAAIEKILTDLQKERVDELQKAVDLVLEREQAARDAEIAAIDKQLDKLEKSRDIKQDQLDLEEKILAVQEAQAALANAQAERTVRYYNSLTGQWEWGANASTVKSAQDALKNAQDALNKYYDTQAYNSNVARLNKRKDKANNRYSSTEDYWKGIMSAASTWSGGGTNAAIVKVNADGTAPSGLSYGTQVVTGGGTYAIVPHGTAGSTYNAATGYSSVLIDKNKTTANTTFDSGGVLHGIGGIKATYRDEAVLPPDLTKAMLSPGADSVFATRLAEMRYLYGVDGAMKNCRVGARSTNDHYGNNYSIGGVTISEADAKSMTVYQLAQKARTLAIRNARQ